MNPKVFLRQSLLENRRKIPLMRQEEAKREIVLKALPKLAPYSLILSFASKQEEINLWALNYFLAQEKRLLLPRIFQKIKLKPHLVLNIPMDLERNCRWGFMEPKCSRCKAIDLSKIEAVLVPGLGFDAKFHRIGYGKGYYDRFLSTLSCPTYGVGFKEQFLDTLIPIEPFDVPVQELLLV